MSLIPVNGDRKERRPKLINDPVHGHISIAGKCLEVLDTPEFQRLRYIKQLQAAYCVYPSAQHTRLEHSLGTYHLAESLLRLLREKQPDLEIDERDIQTVSLAGLCHDLGHGCFSHTLDTEIYPRIVENFDWKHEQRSCEILERIVDNYSIDIDHSQLRTVQSLITGDPSKSMLHRPMTGRRFLWDIVANERSGLDVDKYDYLTRDSRECNIKIAFDHARVMQMMRVVDDEICFNSRAAESVYDLFHARARMFRYVYFHKVTKACERMITDALILADPVLKLKETVHDVDKFCKLDDSILREIVRSEDPRLEASREIIRRLDSRDLYQMVDEFIVPADHAQHFRKPTEDDLLQYKDPSAAVTASDLIVRDLRIDYGRGERNPVDSVNFYDDREESPRKVPIPQSRVSNMIPQAYRDITVRLYIKRSDREMEVAARDMFVKYQKRVFGREVMRTPSISRHTHKRPRSANEGNGRNGREGGLDDEEEEEDINCSQTEAQSNTHRSLFPQ